MNFTRPGIVPNYCPRVIKPINRQQSDEINRLQDTSLANVLNRNMIIALQGVLQMTIVLATDGKPHTQGAVDYAFKYAKMFSEPLYVVSVVTSRMETDMDFILERTHALFETLKERGLQEEVEVHALLEYGPPAENVMALAERLQASVIIVGTSEKTVLDRVILGSVSDHIVRNARSTVIVVR